VTLIFLIQICNAIILPFQKFLILK
jgi:hypothetical protein